jgi:hypothetical protein
MNSKLGLHIQVRPPHWKAFLKAARPCIVKSMDLHVEDEWEDLIAEIRAETGWPDFDIFLLGRVQVPQSLGLSSRRRIETLDNPEASAQALWAEIQARTQHPEVFDAWEGYNEIGTGSVEEIKRLARFDAELARILHDNGLQVAMGGFSVTQPRLSLWPYYYETALPHADYLHLHEVSWPTMQKGVGARCLYYRALYAVLPEELRRPVIISECGLDRKVDEPTAPHGGWKESGCTAAEYMAQLAWYDRELQQDDYVIGAAIFTYGATSDWASFDVYQEEQGQPAGMLKRLQETLAQRNTEPHRRWWVRVAPITPPRPKPLPSEVIRGYAKIGLNANRPLMADGTVPPRLQDPAIIAQTGARWARIDFVSNPPHALDDAWFDTYRGILKGLTERGLRIFGLVGAETVGDPRNIFRYPPLEEEWLPEYAAGYEQRFGVNAAQVQQRLRDHIQALGDQPGQWIETYVAAFEKVVAGLKDYVRVFESFNEPDDWHCPPNPDRLDIFGHQWAQSWVHPYWFAKMLTEIYKRVKGHDVTLVSGPLQGLAINNNAAREYMRQTYTWGKQCFGWHRGAWPFHGIGYHIYVVEGLNNDYDATKSAIQSAYATYLDGMWGVIQAFEGETPTSRLYVSEYGWRSLDDQGDKFEECQKRNLETATEILADDSRVALATWFCMQDFNVPQFSYGLYSDAGDVPPVHTKPAHDTLCEIMTTIPAFETFTLCGQVVSASDGSPLAGTTVLLLTPDAVPAGAEQLQPNGVAWTRKLTDFYGNRYQCWELFVKTQVPGYEDWAGFLCFMEEVMAHNPNLDSDFPVFHRDETYLLPERVVPADGIIWTRKLAGYSGYRWHCWEKVLHRMGGISFYHRFKDEVMERNRNLKVDKGVFYAPKTYWLPKNVLDPQPYFCLRTTTSADGSYAFGGLPRGEYDLLVARDGYQPFAEGVEVQEDTSYRIELEPKTPRMRSWYPDYETLHPKVKTVIDQALQLLGDDADVYDALPDELKPLVHGSRFAEGHPYHKDMACCDLVTVCLAAAGVDYHWQVTEPPGTYRTTTYFANYYRPSEHNKEKLKEITDADDWLPGDIIIYYKGDVAETYVGHVNLYIGPFSGTDLNGRTYYKSQGYDVVNASVVWPYDEEEYVYERVILPHRRADCLAHLFDRYTAFKHLRLIELEKAFHDA